MKILKIIIVVLIMSLFAHNVLALTIISPKEGDTVYAGENLTITLKPDSGENWAAVFFGFDAMTYNPTLDEYTITIQVPKDYYGYYDNLVFVANDNSGNSIKLRGKIFVKMPPNVILQGIVAGSKIAYGSTLVLLRKLPEGSNPTDIEKYEKSEIRVDGKYSDGVKRKLTSSASGTTYTSSDETIATVDSEGKVTARKIGETIITVKNGSYSATVDVIVETYK